MPLLLSLLLLCPPAEAGFGALIKAASKAGKVAKVGKVAKAGKLATAAGAVAVAERGGLVLARVGDEPGRVAAYVARQGDEVATLTRHGDDLGAARFADDAQVDFYVDPSAGLLPDGLPVRDGARYRAVDAAGEVHPMEQVDGVWVVDLGDGLDVGMELGQFAADQLLNTGDGDDHSYWVLPVTKHCFAELAEAAGEDLLPGATESVVDSVALLRSQLDTKLLVVGDVRVDNLAEVAMLGGNDLLALSVSDPCHRDVARMVRDAQAEARAGAQAPLAGLATAASTTWHAEDPVHLEMRFADAGVLEGARWVVHGPEVTADESDDGPPAWFMALCLVIAVPIVWFKYKKAG